MYREKEYKALLRKKFETIQFCNEPSDIILKMVSSYNNCNFNRNILNDIKDKYGFDLSKVIKFNNCKFNLWRNEFCCNQDSTIVTEVIAYVSLCCLSDLILDSHRLGENEKKVIINVLSADFFEERNKLKNPTYNNSSVLYLYDCFLSALKRIENYDITYYISIKNDVMSAFQSEIYISTHSLLFPDRVDINDLTSKSIEFVKAGLQLCAYDTDDRSRMDLCAEAVAKLFWLIDDLCDLYDDLKNNIKNSIIYLQEGKTYNIENSIDFVFSNIDVFFECITDNLNYLKDNLSTETFNFFLYELYDWIIGIREEM